MGEDAEKREGVKERNMGDEPPVTKFCVRHFLTMKYWVWVLCIFVAVRFGRKRTMLGFFAVKIVGILMAVFASNYTVFAIGRFLVGGGQVGYFLPGFVLGIMSVILVM